MDTKKSEPKQEETETPVVTPTMEPHDDRLDHVTIWYGPNPRQLVSEVLSKREAFEKLYDYYSNNPYTTTVPRNLPDDGAKINSDVIYCKLRYKDYGTGKMISVIKDLPLWISVERAISHKHHVEIVTKVEHDEFYRNRDKEQNAWREIANQESQRLQSLGK